MILNRFDIWIADMKPSKGTEPGKIRPVVIIQNNYLHQRSYPSTIVCPISSQQEGVSLLRLPIEPSVLNGLEKVSSVIPDQITAIDVLRLKHRIGALEPEISVKLMESLSFILDIE